MDSVKYTFILLKTANEKSTEIITWDGQSNCMYVVFGIMCKCIAN